MICDEAQNIKNPDAKSRQVLSRLKSRHRLCLTGTPIENHLGELWSLLDYLNPGILLEYPHFRKFFRRPIEEDGNARRHELLNRRIHSLIVRRTKDEVAKELPKKTQITERVALLPDQAALYESIRLACVKEVQDVIAEKGVGQGTMHIFTILLKLQQACCDPRLLKSKHKNLPGSGKREAMMAALATMIEDGRSVLIFSKYTEMLDLMEPDLHKAGIPFVRLDGDTTDRDTPVTRFSPAR